MIELLVTIAIIMILAGMLLPAIILGKRRAQSIGCLLNTRQIQIERSIALDDGTSTELGSIELARAIVSEVGSRNKNWICQSTRIPLTPRAVDEVYRRGTISTTWELGDWLGFLRINLDGIGDETTVEPVRRSSYCANGWLLGKLPRETAEDDDSVKQLRYMYQSDISEPLNTPVISDGVDPLAFPSEDARPPSDLSNGGNPDAPGANLGDTMQSMMIARHGTAFAKTTGDWAAGVRLPGAINIAFADGSSRSVTLESMWQLCWHKSWQTPTVRPGLR